MTNQPMRRHQTRATGGSTSPNASKATKPTTSNTTGDSDSYEVERPLPPQAAENQKYQRDGTDYYDFDRDDDYERGSPNGRLADRQSLDSRSSMSSKATASAADSGSSAATSRNLLDPSDETTTTTNAPKIAGGKTPKANSKQQQPQQHQHQHQQQQAKQHKRPVLVISMLVISLLVGLLASGAILMLPSFVSHQISKKLVLKNNSFLLDRWARPNVPMYFKVWLFDIKNGHELMERRNSKPDLQEVGPFVFKLRRQKDILHFAGDNLYYSEKKFYHFVPEMSCCSINTTVTVPNVPLVAVVDRALGYQLPLVSRFVPRLINRAIQSLREPMFVRKQARELLFDGYDVQLLRMISRVGSLIGLPQTQQRFAIFKDRNNTWRPDLDGIWAINTGENDRNRFGKVHSWNSYRQLPFWESGSQCNQINGSDGTLFAPPISKTEPIYIFNQEICRSVSLKFMRDSDIRAIQAYRFTLNPMNFAHTQTSQIGAGAGGTTSSRRVGQQTLAPNRFASSPFVRQPMLQSTGLPPVPLPHQEPTRATSGNSGATGGSRRAQSPPTESFSGNNNNNSPSSARIVRRQATGATSTTPATNKPTPSSDQTTPNNDWTPLPLNPYPCFCDRKTSNLNGIGVCEFDGLIDLSRCNKQTQAIFGSMPHFYNTDTRLLKSVKGLEPDASKHQTYVDIEPNTGIVLGGKRRVQLNLMIKHNNEIEGFQNINDMLVPLVWFEESAMIPEESAQKFRSLFVERVRLVNILLGSLLLGAVLVLLINLRLLATRRRNSKVWQPDWTATNPAPGQQLGPKGLLKGQAPSGVASGNPQTSSPSPTKHTISSAGSVGLDAPLLAKPNVAKPTQNKR